MTTTLANQSIQVRNLSFKQQNVGKFFDWSKKSYLWTFEAKKCNEWLLFKIQFLDSLKSGKRTLIVND
jgi:hypothetical protein